ncbi:MAG: isocitrate dehydrogenase kinase/phosphatase AceK regulatory subunit, partial [Desulfobacterales bacterium]|nr:isocitrate dehydrogenase kinase/phosphatase AceK regulatory subunit [Desulfobacterales bacterium]
MSQKKFDHRPVKTGARAIKETFINYRKQFDEITARAFARFKALDWPGMRADAAARLEIYKNEVDRVESTIRQLLVDQVEDKLLWASLKT